MIPLGTLQVAVTAAVEFRHLFGKIEITNLIFCSDFGYLDWFQSVIWSYWINVWYMRFNDKIWIYLKRKKLSLSLYIYILHKLKTLREFLDGIKEIQRLKEKEVSSLIAVVIFGDQCWPISPFYKRRSILRSW